MAPSSNDRPDDTQQILITETSSQARRGLELSTDQRAERISLEKSNPDPMKLKRECPTDLRNNGRRPQRDLAQGNSGMWSVISSRVSGSTNQCSAAQPPHGDRLPSQHPRPRREPITEPERADKQPCHFRRRGNLLPLKTWSRKGKVVRLLPKIPSEQNGTA